MVIDLIIKHINFIILTFDKKIENYYLLGKVILSNDKTRCFCKNEPRFMPLESYSIVDVKTN